ncbi:substrate-binding domain-containing protein, partial [Salmonella enterica subsp. enterica serovar Saphra]
YPPALDALAGHALIGFDTEAPYIRRLRPAGLAYARERFALRTDSDLAALAAIRAGFGIGMTQVQLARRDPLLVRLFPAELSLPLETWV